MMKEEAVSTKKRRRKYDCTFKAEAVALWQKSGKSAEEIAAQLGIREGQLYAWKATSEIRAGPQADLQAENAALRRENELLRQQRDILKKTLGIISEPPRSASNGSTQ
jgi:transposase-like protein